MSTIHTLVSGTGSEWTCDPRWASEGFETFAGTIREELLSVLWDGEAAKPQPKVGHPGGSCLGRHQPGQQRQLYAVIEKPALSVQSNVQGRGRAADVPLGRAQGWLSEWTSERGVSAATKRDITYDERCDNSTKRL